MSDREHDADTLRRLRYSPEVERTLKQFQKYANQDSPSEYKARYEYAFNFSPDKRASVDALVSQGLSFLDAFAAVSSRSP